MADRLGSDTTLRALLIGADCYLPHRLEGGAYYPSLSGCVRDINLVDNFFRAKLKCSTENIIKLTASNDGSPRPPEPPELWPTYEAMVAAFNKVIEVSSPGDQVYIQYSGHGARVPTKLPALKGRGGLDEALAPIDIGRSHARYLRDIEMACLLKRMADKGLFVTLVLDCCHSGGMTRGRRAPTARGVSFIDSTSRPEGSLVASDGEILETFRGLSKPATRGLAPSSGWLPATNGFVFLGACRPSEVAYEYAFEGDETNGVLTYWLLDSLKQIGSGLTYKQVYERVLAKIHGQFESQTPLLEGEVNRVFLGVGKVQPHQAAVVMGVDPQKQMVLLGAGQAQSLGKGAQFAIYRSAETNFENKNKRLALVEITQIGSAYSWAEIKLTFNQSAIEQGDQAVWVGSGDIRSLRTVDLIRRDDALPAADQQRALSQIKHALTHEGAGFVRLASDNEPADFQVAISNHKYEVWDPAGHRVANLRPEIGINESGAASRLVRRLVHLAKYRNIQQIDNGDPLSPLAGKLKVDIIGTQSDYDPADRPDPKPFAIASGVPMLKSGEWVFLRVRNDSSQILNIAALDLQPDWGISQIFPPDEGSHFFPFDPGQQQVLPLRAGLPTGYEEGRDVIKVFATVGTTNFRWLELPALDEPPMPRTITRGQFTDPLEELFSLIAINGARTLNLSVAAYPSREWVTSQVEVRITL